MTLAWGWIDGWVGCPGFACCGLRFAFRSSLAILLHALDEAVLAATEGGEAWFPAAGDAEAHRASTHFLRSARRT
jgi:hypothetical protein